MKTTNYNFLTSCLLCALLAINACKEQHISKNTNTSNSDIQQKLVIPSSQAYNGAYIDFGAMEDNVTLEGIESFDQLVGRKQAIIGFSNYWGKESFPSEQLKIISAYGAVPLIYWNPWEGPLEDKKAKDRVNLNDILAGKWDNYLAMWSMKAKEFKKPMLVSWGLEMNGNWFPWCSVFYGGGNVIEGSNPVLYEGPEFFKKVYRYIVDKVRAQGANNIQWIFHPNNTPDPYEPWNKMINYYPGDNYVDWLGLSAYGKQYPGPGWEPFEGVLPKFYNEITEIAPHKPFILAEWGVGEFPKEGSKAEWIAEALRRFSSQFPQMKGMVFWHERWQNGDLRYSNLRVNSSLESLEEYRKGIANSFWLDSPIYDDF